MKMHLISDKMHSSHLKDIVFKIKCKMKQKYKFYDKSHAYMQIELRCDVITIESNDITSSK